MKALWILLTLALTMPAFARQTQETQAAPAPVGIVIDSVDLKDLGTDRVRFDISSHVTADRNLKIKRVRFEGMRLGSIPVYLSPIEEHLALQKDTPVTLPRVPVTIYFRDLDSLEPIERAVSDGHATITGRARIDLDLNLIEQVLSHQREIHADIPVEVTTPVEVPGGMPGKIAAVTTLRAAQFALNLGNSALHALRQSQKDWEQEIRTRYVPSMLVAESRYSVRLKSGEKADFVVHGLGFRTSEDQFVLTDEMVEPWKYDMQIAAALQTHEASLIDDSIDLLVWPAGETPGANNARTLSEKLIRVEHKSEQSEVAHIPSEGKSVKVHVSKRDSDANYAVLRFTRADDKGTAIQLAPDSAMHGPNWDRVSMFRVADDGTLEMISTPAHRQDKRIVLDDPVDDRALGSLVITPDGALGMMQAEQSGMLLRNSW